MPIDDDDTDGRATSAPESPTPPSSPPSHPDPAHAAAAAGPQMRKGVSYSQPLTRDALATASARRNALRKHSLEDDPSWVMSYQQGFFQPPMPPCGSAAGGDGGGDGSLTLERAMCEYGGNGDALPEFVGNGGGKGIFRVPLRAAMHPSRPPPLELRPHPMRETQAGAFLRTMACCRERMQLWAGAECGLRVWKLDNVYASWGENAAPRRGDEESAPFRESSATPPVVCIAVDNAAGLVWTGHKDGKIRSWRMELAEDEDKPFKEGLSWQAHQRAPVLCMAVTSYGEIWSGSEGGAIRAWPWEAIQKSLSLTQEERHMAALLVERSYIDLRNMVTVNGVCPLSPSDVKHILVDNCKSNVWTVMSMTFALWDGHKRELLKVFGMDGQVETARLEPPPSQEQNPEDEMKVKFASSSKKEKQGSFTFLQRSRNALMGAADAVRRVATKGAFVEDNRKTGAIGMAMDGTIWSGCTNGSIIQWDGNGCRLQEFQHNNSFVQSICAFGDRVWVGYACGTIQVMDLDGNLIGVWVAHSSPVIRMAVVGSYIYTLGHHGGIRGWRLSSPGPLDDIIRTELANRELSYTKLENIKILVGTWNVGQEKASHDSLISWLGNAASDVGIVVVGLQEVEMGAGFLAMAAAKETVGLEGSANGQWWIDTIGKILDEGSTFQRVGSRQLASLLISAWARKSVRSHVGDVDAAAVACGLGRAIGNKGAVSLRMRVYDRVVCFASCHFAAHLEAVSKRNADFDHVYRTMSYNKLHGAAAAATSVQLHRTVNATLSQPNDAMPELSDADMIVFLGDFNYRLGGISYDEARDMVSQRSFDWLREKDQLRTEMKAGRVFQGMREGQIKFPPTYKFQRHQPGLAGYDSGEKKRIPAWCDRILYRDTRASSVAACSLECPVVASILLYEGCMDVTDSDHKPVRCIFNVDVAHVDELIRRQEYGDIIESNEKIRSLFQDSHVIPDTVVSRNNIILENQEKTVLQITNNNADNISAVYQILCEGQSTIKENGEPGELTLRGCYGFPLWLQVSPAVGIIEPGETVEVTLSYQDFYEQEEFIDGVSQHWWCEDTKDKVVSLSVNITGTGSTRSKSHKINVRQRLSTERKNPTDSAKGSSGRNQSELKNSSESAKDSAAKGQSELENENPSDGAMDPSENGQCDPKSSSDSTRSSSGKNESDTKYSSRGVKVRNESDNTKSSCQSTKGSSGKSQSDSKKSGDGTKGSSGKSQSESKSSIESTKSSGKSQSDSKTSEGTKGSGKSQSESKESTKSKKSSSKSQSESKSSKKSSKEKISKEKNSGKNHDSENSEKGSSGKNQPNPMSKSSEGRDTSQQEHHEPTSRE